MAAEKIVQASLSGVLLVLLSGPTDTAARFAILGHELICTCGCGQVLLECNHVGCASSSRMIAELRAALARGDSDTTILHAFQAEYGPTALAVPMFSRFNMTAWIVPPAVLLLGALMTVLIIRRWNRTKEVVVGVESPELLAIRNEIRKETEA